MRPRRAKHLRRAIWLAPAFMGAALILLGLLLFYQPWLLVYAIAAGLIATGVVLLAAAVRTRTSVTYTRVDQNWGTAEDADER